MGKKQRIKELEKYVAELEARIMGLEARPTQYSKIPRYPNPWHPKAPLKRIDWWRKPTDYCNDVSHQLRHRLIDT